jgi:anthraniloyl-CoA monooxygenase
LIVACDGVNSRVRQLYGDHFRTGVGVGWIKYIGLGTHKVFDAFTFAFEEMHHLSTTPWLNFRRISNGNWCHDNIVLMGDAAHITHFTIGSGTKLAIENAIGLAEKLHDHKDLQAALKAYEEERRVSLLALQSAARNSARWFENVQRHIDQEAINFAFSLVTRRQEATAPVKIPWHYQLHWAAREIAALRRLRTRLWRWIRSARRGVRAGR